MDELEDIDTLFFSETPIDKEKLMKNFFNLKETFKGEVSIIEGCSDCTKSKREANEDYCKSCTLWQKSPDIKDSELRGRPWGLVRFYTSKRDYTFRTLTGTVHQLNGGVDFKSIQAIWGATPERVDIFYPLIHGANIACVPKYSSHPNWMVHSVEELLAFYDLYRAIPYTILRHDKHGKNFPENGFFKLELVK